MCQHLTHCIFIPLSKNLKNYSQLKGEKKEGPANESDNNSFHLGSVLRVSNSHPNARLTSFISHCELRPRSLPRLLRIFC